MVTFKPTRRMSVINEPLPGPNSTSWKCLGFPAAIHSLTHHMPSSCQKSYYNKVMAVIWQNYNHNSSVYRFLYNVFRKTKRSKQKEMRTD